MLPGYLILDVDDTLTQAQKLTPEVLHALARAAGAGIEVILDTGRSAGWGAALLSYLPAVSAVVVENGGAWFDGRAGGEVYVQLLRAQQADERSRLHALRERLAARLDLSLRPTADDPFRLTDHTVVRALPHGHEGAALISRMRDLLAEESSGAASLLASSVHIHLFFDGEPARSKAAGAEALLRSRGVADPALELSTRAVAVGDSANDASLFAPGRFALSVGVRNIEGYLPELGGAMPQHITREGEGAGVVELIDDLLAGRLSAHRGCV